MTTVLNRPSTKAEQRAASIDAILGGALGLFVSHGYRDTTVDAIAEAAGLTKGAVYFYFKSKDGVLLALLDRVEAVVADRMIERVDAAGPDATDKMVAFVHGQAALGVEAWEHVLLLILMSLEFGGAGNEIEVRVREIYGRMYDAVREILRQGRYGGAFRSDIPLDEQTAVVMAGHDGTFLEWYRRPRELDGGALVRALRVATLGGLSNTSEIGSR